MILPGAIGFRGYVKEPPYSGGGTPTYSSLGFSVIPTSSTDFTYKPAAGVEQWHFDNIVNVPSSGTSTPRSDKYWRFNWAGLNPTNGGYDWTYFDTQINAAIDAGQKFSFGIMTQYDGGAGSPGITTYSGGASAYPQWLHTQMQSETVKDWLYGGHDWVPNWNSDYYKAAFQTFCIALNNHLYTTSHSGVLYSDAINWIDLRGYGNFGEWHVYPYKDSEPSGTHVTTQSLKDIIDIQKNAFPNFQLQAMVAGFDPTYWSEMPTEISYKLLTDSNSVGEFGWRRDSWCDDSFWYPQLLENNPGSYMGVMLKDLIMNKWKYAPITGEPCCQACGTIAPDHVNRYHVTSWGNGNYAGYTAAQIVAASKLMGYRIILNGGEAPSSMSSGSNFHITLNWRNVGVAPVYENWTVKFELKNASNTTVWTGNSIKNLRLYLPAGSDDIVTDNFVLPSLSPGSYTLRLIITGTPSFRLPFPLYINGRNADGSYTLVSGLTIT